MFVNDIEIETDADHTLSQNGTIHLIVNDKTAVSISFDADFESKGTPNEYWGNDLAVSGESHIEVNSVSNLKVIDISSYPDGTYRPADFYKINEADEKKIKEHIKYALEEYVKSDAPSNTYYFK